MRAIDPATLLSHPDNEQYRTPGTIVILTTSGAIAVVSPNQTLRGRPIPHGHINLIVHGEHAVETGVARLGWCQLAPRYLIAGTWRTTEFHHPLLLNGYVSFDAGWKWRAFPEGEWEESVEGEAGSFAEAQRAVERAVNPADKPGR